MKRLLIAVFLALNTTAYAQDDISQGTGIIGNGRLLGAQTYDGQTIVGVLGIDAAGNTKLNSLLGHSLQCGGDINRLHVFGAASDAALSYKFGDSGTTATQALTISSSTPDADDDSTLALSGGGDYGATPWTRGSYLVLRGEEVSGGGDLLLGTGQLDDILFQVGGTTELTCGNDSCLMSGATSEIGTTGATALNVKVANTTQFTVSNTGTLIGTGTATLGWAVVDGTDNTACSTQCTTPAVFGFNLSAGPTAPTLVGPADATADICLCAGAS